MRQGTNGLKIQNPVHGCEKEEDERNKSKGKNMDGNLL